MTAATHNDVMTKLIFRAPTGQLVLIDPESTLRIVAPVVDPDWANVLAAAGLMYQQLTHQYECLSRYLEYFDVTQENGPLSEGIQAMQSAILDVQRVALEGAEQVVKSMPKGKL